MSLTNPKNVVTEERLSEFYHQILPYLGNVPDLVMSKFKQSDIYSTSERIVGQWVDGKPLYQKTIRILNPAISWSKISLASYISNPSVVFKKDEYAIRSDVEFGGDYYYLDGDRCSIVPVKTNSDGWCLFIKCTSTISTLYVTLCYTKTTDTLIAVGTVTDYSTTEKIVGTWIDGSPVYQITVSDTISVTSNSWAQTTLSSAGIRQLVSLKCMDNVGSIFNGFPGVLGTDYVEIYNPMPATITCSSITLQYVKESS